MDASAGEVSGQRGFSHYLLLLRLILARRLAQSTRLPMAEIAVRSGYQDASAMARAFRSEFGLTPSQARHLAQS